MNFSDLYDTHELTALLRGVADKQTENSPHQYRAVSFRHVPAFPHGTLQVDMMCTACDSTARIEGPEAIDDPVPGTTWPWVLDEQRVDCPATSASTNPEAKAAFEAGYRSGLNEAARRIVEFMETIAGEPEQPGHELAIDVHPMAGPIGKCSCSKFSMIGPVDLVTQFHALHVADPATTPTGREAGS